MFLSKVIDKIDFKNKIVFLRADLNVPFLGKKILCDHKLQSTLPTIKILLQKGAKIFLATHLGRPFGMPKGPKAKFSTDILVPWFQQRNYKIKFESNLQQAKKIIRQNEYDIVLGENLRFFEQEIRPAKEFAKKLAQIGEYLVNDAFGTMHRNDTSMTLLTKMFEKNKRFLGLLVEHELQILHEKFEDPKRPFIAIIGGGKPGTKIPIIENLLEKTDTILLCPAIVFTFAKAIGKNIGKSLVDDKLLSMTKKILKKAKNLKKRIILPVDYLVAKNNFNGPISRISTDDIPKNFLGLSPGPKTLKIFSQEIKNSKTVFFNGAFGNPEKPISTDGMRILFNQMAKITKFSAIGGGDSVGFAFMMGIAKKIDYLSTGGGATIAYISGMKLPGLEAFEK